jgi:hypothetical protein
MAHTVDIEGRLVIVNKAFTRLRIYNVIMGFFHAASGTAVVVLSNDFSLPVTANFLAGPPGTPPGTPEVLFDVPVGYAVASFLFLSALAHFLIAMPGIFPWYTANLGANRNYARWMEYSISSSIMVTLIAMIPGIYDISALVPIFVVNATMIWFGALMEKYEQPGKPNWLSYIFGCLSGIVPWLIIAFYIWSPTTEANPPSFVYAIFVVLFIFFNSFAINMILQYKRVGPWRNYLFGESTYILLSLVAKTILAWMVFSNTLVAS